MIRKENQKANPKLKTKNINHKQLKNPQVKNERKALLREISWI